MTSTLTRTKRCTKCDTVKPVDEFRWRTQKGVHAPRSHCRKCEAAYNRARPVDPEAHAKDLARIRAKNYAEYGISVEVDQYVRVTGGRGVATALPLPTAEELADWHRRGCPL